MEPKVIIVIVITILMVVGVNGALILLFKNRGSRSSFSFLLRAFRGNRNIWKDEDRDIKELSRLVTQLNKTSEQGEDNLSENE